MHFPFEKKTACGFALALVLLTVVGVVSIGSMQRTGSDAERVKHTHEVVAAIERLLQIVGYDGARHRGYLITGDEAFLRGHPQALADTEATFGKLRGLIADNPEQEMRLAALGLLIVERHELARLHVAMRKSDGFEAVQKRVMTGRGERMLDEIYRLAGEMTAHEATLLKGREMTSKASARNAQVVIVLASLLTFALVGGALGLLARELAARRRGEEALRRSEEKRSLVTAAVEVGTWDWNIVTGELVWSERCKRLFGIPGDAEMTYDRFLQALHPDDRARAHAAVNLGIEAKEDYKIEFRTVWPDGTVRWVTSRGQVDYDAAGQPLHMAGMAWDIDERKRLGEALGQSQEVLALAIEGGHFGIWDWDLVADRLDWSERCKAMAGLAPDAETSYAVFLSTMHPDDRERVQTAVATALEKKVDSEVEYRTVWPDGTVRWVQARGHAFEDASGRPFRFCGITLDVTERKQSEEALRRFNAELEALVLERTEVIEIAMQDLREEISERRRLEEEILGIGEREQARIGQDLHDDLGQQLVGMAMLSHLLSTQLSAEAHPQAADADRLNTFLAGSITTTRNLAKSLYPVELERGGLMLALRDLACRTELLAGIVCAVRADDAFLFDKAAEIHLYRIVQESIGNALKHGRARNIAIECLARAGASTLTVTDDGSGFAPPAEGKRAGMGLHVFQYRARLIGAGLTVARGPDGGCQVRCALGRPNGTPVGGGNVAGTPSEPQLG